MSKPVVTPGEYSLTELSDMFNVSRKTAERYVPRYSIETTIVTRYNKPVTGVLLTQEIIDKINTDNQVSQPVVIHDQTGASQGQANGETNKPHASTSVQTDKVVDRLLELSEKVLAQTDELIKTRDELKDKKNEIITLNNERANSNSQLTKYKDTKKELEEYQEKLKAAQRIAAEAEEAKAQAKALQDELDKLKSEKLEADKKLTQELQALKADKDALTSQLEAERKKHPLVKLFGR